MNIYLDLYLTFAKVGVLTFGGGYAMLPILEREVAEKHSWVSEEELMDYYAVGQCTPGVIAVNTATFVGKKQAGIPGGIAATLGVITPSFIIICFIAGLVQAFQNIPAVKSAFAGIRVCVCVLIFNSVVKLWKKAVKGKTAFLIFLLVFILSFFTNISPIVFVIISASVGIVLELIGNKEK